MYCYLYKDDCIGKFCSASKVNYTECHYSKSDSGRLNMSEKTVTITEKRYYELLEDSRFLDALRATGVDNWSGYEYAQEMIEEWDKEEN